MIRALTDYLRRRRLRARIASIKREIDSLACSPHFDADTKAIVIFGLVSRIRDLEIEIVEGERGLTLHDF